MPYDDFSLETISTVLGVSVEPADDIPDAIAFSRAAMAPETARPLARAKC